VIAIPAWVVALTALVAAWGVLSARAMPLPFRIALAAPRLACFLIYLMYATVDMDIASRAVITRFLLLILFLTEAISAPFINRARRGVYERV
jgi:hypothetical protein